MRTKCVFNQQPKIMHTRVVELGEMIPWLDCAECVSDRDTTDTIAFIVLIVFMVFNLINDSTKYRTQRWTGHAPDFNPRSQMVFNCHTNSTLTVVLDLLGPHRTSVWNAHSCSKVRVARFVHELEHTKVREDHQSNVCFTIFISFIVVLRSRSRCTHKLHKRAFMQNRWKRNSHLVWATEFRTFISMDFSFCSLLTEVVEDCIRSFFLWASECDQTYTGAVVHSCQKHGTHDEYEITQKWH